MPAAALTFTLNDGNPREAAAEAKLEQVNSAIEELRNFLPTVPVGEPEGARDEFSGYLHLIINTWDMDALSLLVGESRARTAIKRRSSYT